MRGLTDGCLIHGGFNNRSLLIYHGGHVSPSIPNDMASFCVCQKGGNTSMDTRLRVLLGRMGSPYELSCVCIHCLPSRSCMMLNSPIFLSD